MFTVADAVEVLRKMGNAKYFTCHEVNYKGRLFHFDPNDCDELLEGYGHCPVTWFATAGRYGAEESSYSSVASIVYEYVYNGEN